jgi:hypothetical protein
MKIPRALAETEANQSIPPWCARRATDKDVVEFKCHGVTVRPNVGVKRRPLRDARLTTGWALAGGEKDRKKYLYTSCLHRKLLLGERRDIEAV